LLLAGGLLLPAATDPPAPVEVLATERHLTLRSEALSITPSLQVVYLRFSKGVTVTSEGFQLSADVVELDINPGEVLQDQGLMLPKVPEDIEHIVREPGQTIAEMAYELELPQARFTPSSLRRVGAQGGVRVESAEGVVLTTNELISTDGGRAWAAISRSQLWRDDAEGNHAELSADYLLLDSLAGRALARGNIEGVVAQTGYSAVTFTAQSCEMDLAEQTLHISEGLEARFRNLNLCCGSLYADLEENKLYASDTPHLLDAENGISLDATRIEADISAQTAVAEGDVWINDPVPHANLSAGRIDADLRAKVYTATGSPELRYGDSLYSGQTITISLRGEQTVIEVEGPQHARINIDELTAAGAARE